MLSIHASSIDRELAVARELKCVSIDYAAVTAAEITNDPNLQGCTFPPEYAVAVQPAEDMVIPLFVCKLHYNSFKLGLSEGIGISEDLLR